MQLTIYLSKEVPDAETAQEIVNIVAEKLIDHPEVRIQASTNCIVDVPEPPPT